MYIPPLFAENDHSELRILIAEHPLATLVYRVGETMEAQHIPLIFNGENKLIGHIASNNEIVAQLRDGDSVLAIFQAKTVIYPRTGTQVRRPITTAFPD